MRLTKKFVHENSQRCIERSGAKSRNLLLLRAAVVRSRVRDMLRTAVPRELEVLDFAPLRSEDSFEGGSAALVNLRLLSKTLTKASTEQRSARRTGTHLFHVSLRRRFSFFLRPFGSA